MKKQYIQFKFKNKTYTFSRPFTPGMDSLKWIYECYRSVGATPGQVTNRWTTHTGWSHWCPYIA